MRSLKILVLTVFLSFAGISVALAMGDIGMTQQTLIGKLATDFTLDTVQGKKVNFTEYRNGQKAVIFFWATWCPHCREELKHVNELQAKLTSQGIRLVIISLGEEKSTVQDYLARHHYTFDVLLDENQSLEEPYRIIGVPTLFFVDERGVIKMEDHSFPKNYEEVFK